MSLIQTRTEIATSISPKGLRVFVRSHEIGSILNFSENVMEKIFNLIKDDSSFVKNEENFSKIIEYFLTDDKEEKTSICRKMIGQDFWYNVFNYIKKNGSLFKTHNYNPGSQNFEINPGHNNIYSNSYINLSCLVDREIINGKEFHYKGIFNKELINQNIAPALQYYSRAVIKLFGLARKA